MELNDDFIIAMLNSVSLFEGMDDFSLLELGHLFKEKIYDQKETIFEEGSIGSTMMIIASGEVRVSQKANPGGEEEEALMILKKGDVFGEMALLEDLPRSATIIAHTNVIAMEICREDFFNYIFKAPQNGVKILLKLCKTLSSRLRETDEKLKAFISFSQWL